MSTYTKFGPDRLRFAGLIPERLNFQPTIMSFCSRLIVFIGVFVDSKVSRKNHIDYIEGVSIK